MGIPILRGRAFQETDTAAAPRVALIDQFLARKYWPGGDPVGGKIQSGLGKTDPPFTIVGVVRTVKTADLAEQNPVGQVYFPYQQFRRGSTHLVLKTEAEDARVVSALRGELRKLDAELPLFDVKTLPERLAGSVTNRRAAMILCLLFAGLAMVLSAIGIYGVLAYTVTQRTREFGIRLALGAQAGDVLGMVFWQGLRLALGGLVVGAAGSWVLTRLLTSLLYEVKPTDPVVFLAVAAVLAVVALGASLLPSRRATRIDPAVALRYE